MLGEEDLENVLLTSWPTFAMSPHVMDAVEERALALFSADGCGAMTTGD